MLGLVILSVRMDFTKILLIGSVYPVIKNVQNALISSIPLAKDVEPLISLMKILAFRPVQLTIMEILVTLPANYVLLAVKFARIYRILTVLSVGVVTC